MNSNDCLSLTNTGHASTPYKSTMAFCSISRRESSGYTFATNAQKSFSAFFCSEYSRSIEVCGSTRTRGYGSGTGRCLTGRVGYGYEVHGYGYTRFTRKNIIFHDVGAISNVFYFFFKYNLR